MSRERVLCLKLVYASFAANKKEGMMNPNQLWPAISDLMNPYQMWDAIRDLIFAVPLGVVLLLMMFKARKKSGNRRWYMMPLVLYYFLWDSWGTIRSIGMNYLISDMYYDAQESVVQIYGWGIRFVYAIVLLMAFSPYVMKDKQRAEIGS